MAEQRRGESYQWPARFEQELATVASQRPQFWATVAHEVDPDCLEDPPARLAFEAARAIANDHGGRGPDSLSLVLARISRWRSEGRVTVERLNAVVEMYDARDIHGLPSEDSLRGEVLPVIKRRLEKAAVLLSTDAYGARKDLTGVRKLIDRAEDLGSATPDDIGSELGSADSFEEIDKLGAIPKIATGIHELDGVLNGGLPKSYYGLFTAPYRGGKSAALFHCAAQAQYDGGNVLVASFELQRASVDARLLANLTCIPINSIMGDTEARALAIKRHGVLKATGKLGDCQVKEFPGQGATMAQVADWVKSVEDKKQRKYDLLVIDYADRVSAGRSGGRWKAWEDEAVVHQQIVNYARSSGMAIWSAAQTRGREDQKKKRPGLEDTAGSIEKIRLCDVGIVISRDPETGAVSMYYGKGRISTDGKEIGPFDSDFACAQLAPVRRDAEFQSERILGRNPLETF